MWFYTILTDIVPQIDRDPYYSHMQLKTSFKNKSLTV